MAALCVLVLGSIVLGVVVAVLDQRKLYGAVLPSASGIVAGVVFWFFLELFSVPDRPELEWTIWIFPQVAALIAVFVLPLSLASRRERSLKRFLRSEGKRPASRQR